jgi:FMN phosphatase YigB (HAD superfamily)
MRSTGQIEAVTFDFWDTLVIDDSDEIERARRGLPTKEVAREALFVESVLRASPAIPRAAVTEAWAHLQRRFRVAWKDEQRTPGVAERLGWGLTLLGVDAPPTWGEVVDQFEMMEVDIPPDPAPGVEEALRALSSHYRLGIISDTIITRAACCGACSRA